MEASRLALISRVLTISLKCGRCYQDAHSAQEACEILASISQPEADELVQVFGVKATVLTGLITVSGFATEAIAWLRSHEWDLTRGNLQRVLKMYENARPGEAIDDELSGWRLHTGAWWLDRKMSKEEK